MWLGTASLIKCNHGATLFACPPPQKFVTDTFSTPVDVAASTSYHPTPTTHTAEEEGGLQNKTWPSQYDLDSYLIW
jgi:hypothetical protein